MKEKEKRHNEKFYDKLKKGMYIDYRYGEHIHKLLKVVRVVRKDREFPVIVIEYDLNEDFRKIENAYRFDLGDKLQKYKIISKEEAYMELL